MRGARCAQTATCEKRRSRAAALLDLHIVVGPWRVTQYASDSGFLESKDAGGLNRKKEYMQLNVGS